MPKGPRLPGGLSLPAGSQAQRKYQQAFLLRYVPAANVMFVMLFGTTVVGKPTVLPAPVLLS